MASSTNTKVNDLFRVMHASELSHTEYRAYAAMLRDLLNMHVVSGRMLVQDFLNNTSWTGELTDANYAAADVQDFHEFLVRAFSPLGAQASTQEAPTQASTQEASTQEAPTQASTQASTQAPKTTQTAPHKAKWQQLMRPLADEFASESLPTDTIVEFVWQALTDGGALNALYAMGSALMPKPEKAS